MHQGVFGPKRAVIIEEDRRRAEKTDADRVHCVAFLLVHAARPLCVIFSRLKKVCSFPYKSLENGLVICFAW